MKINEITSKEQGCKTSKRFNPKTEVKKKKTIQSKNLHNAAAVIASSGRCYLFPFHHGLCLLLPLLTHKQENTSYKDWFDSNNRQAVLLVRVNDQRDPSFTLRYSEEY